MLVWEWSCSIIIVNYQTKESESNKINCDFPLAIKPADEHKHNRAGTHIKRKTTFSTSPHPFDSTQADSSPRKKNLQTCLIWCRQRRSKQRARSSLRRFQQFPSVPLSISRPPRGPRALASRWPTMIPLIHYERNAAPIDTTRPNHLIGELKLWEYRFY